MSRIPEKRKPMKPQDRKIPANAHPEFAEAIQDEYNRLTKKVKFFDQWLPKQTFVAIVLAHFLDLPEAQRDLICEEYARVYEQIARDDTLAEKAETPPKGAGHDIEGGGHLKKKAYPSPPTPRKRGGGESA